MLKTQSLNLLKALTRVKLLWLPCLIPLPLLLIWQELFLRLEVCALLIPSTLFLHEWLHLLFIPNDARVEICVSWHSICLKMEGTRLYLQALLAALAPSLILSGVGLLVARFDGLFALPFLMHAISFPIDLWGWYGGVVSHEQA